MDSPPVRYVTTTPALPCHVCATLTPVSSVEARDDGKWVLSPCCTNHRPSGSDDEAPQS
jgi:hypothetical protein